MMYTDTMENNNGYPIKVAARMTGLTAHIIRAWEKRYQALVPKRTSGNRRIYSEQDIKKLNLLRDATSLGFRIGEIANNSIEQLEKLIEDAGGAKPSGVEKTGNISGHESAYVERAIRSILDYDDAGLEELLEKAMVDLGEVNVVEKVIVALLQRIGDMWESGEMRTSQEHMASAIIRTFIGNLISLNSDLSGAPHLLVTTPTSHVHENGALVAAMIGSSDGWRVTYLGPDLPAEEIAAAAHRKNSRAVALSLIYPADNPPLVAEIKKIRKLLPDGTFMVLGGHAAESYRPLLTDLDDVVIGDLADFRKLLRKLR